MKSRLRTGSGAVDVVDAARDRLIDRPLDEAEHVVAIDPRHPLLAAADRTTGAELERQKHLCQRAAIVREHDAEAEDDEARERLRRARRRFPLRRDARRETRSRAAELSSSISSPAMP